MSKSRKKKNADPRHRAITALRSADPSAQTPGGPRQLLVDVSQLVIQDYKTGIQRVVRNLIREWLCTPPIGFRVELVYANKEQHGYRYARDYARTLASGASCEGTNEVIQPRPGDIFLGLDFFQALVLNQEAYYQELRTLGVKVYFVVYDLLPILLPQLFPEYSRALHTQWLNVVARGNGALCISRAVADELATWMDEVQPQREGGFQIGWFHLGADLQSSVSSQGLPPEAGELLPTLKARPTFLMVGTIEPRKGLRQALEAFNQLWAQGVDVNLVLVGKPGWKTEKLIHQLQRRHPERGRRLFWLQDVSDEYLDKLYGASDCLIAASLGEGFGLPLIEAAQHGIPIIARDLPVFREVAGESAHYFHGSDPGALAGTIQEWLDFQRAGQAPTSTAMPRLTWKQSAQRVLEVALGGNWYRTWKPRSGAAPSKEAAGLRPLLSKDPDERCPWVRTIGVDAQMLVNAWSYNRAEWEALSHHLQALVTGAPDWRFILFSWDLKSDQPSLDGLLALPNVGWRGFHQVQELSLDLFYDPNLAQGAQGLPAPLWQRLAQVMPVSVAIRDCVPLALGEDSFKLFGAKGWETYLHSFDPLKQSTAQILTSSTSVKRYLVQDLGIQESRMHPIMAGLSQAPPCPEPDEVRAELAGWGIEPPFFLMVDHPLGPANRLDTVLAALALLGDPSLHLVVVGGLDNSALQAYQKAFDVSGQDRVLITGLLSPLALSCFRQAAAGLIQTGTHEGFAFPVLEAMASGCPVIASRAGSLPELVGASALLVEPGDPQALADAMFRVLHDETLRAYLQARGRHDAEGFSWEATAQRTLEAWTELLGRIEPGPAKTPTRLSPGKLKVRWQGSQFVYHSLAHVNRQLCLGLLDSGKVDLSLIPYEPDQFDGSQHPVFSPLAARVNKALSGPAEVHVRHHWPPTFIPPPQGAWVIVQPWEYGGIPRDWVQPMCEQIDEIWVYSTWVRDCYLASGIPEEKVQIIPLGVDTQLFQPEGARFPLSTRRKFRFLFLGGTIHRKGIDILLRAYLKAFRKSDDVCLVIKGQGGQTYLGSELHELLGSTRLEDPEAPEIEYLTTSMEEEDLASLYRACDVFVMPYRGEGFGLPMAEAMACGLPVIATGRGAAMDFLGEDRAYFIPSTRQSIDSVPVGNFQPSAPGFWLEEPDEAALAALLRKVHLDPQGAAAKGRQGRSYAVEHLSWNGSTERVLERLEILAQRAPLRFGGTPTRPYREAFLLRPDWNEFAWVEALMTFATTFHPKDPVALILFIDGAATDLQEVQESVVTVLSSTDHTEFPDIILIDKPEEILDTLKDFDSFYWVPDEPTASLAGLGTQARRFFNARLEASSRS